MAAFCELCTCNVTFLIWLDGITCDLYIIHLPSEPLTHNRFAIRTLFTLWDNIPPTRILGGLTRRHIFSTLPQYPLRY